MPWAVLHHNSVTYGNSDIRIYEWSGYTVHVCRSLYYTYALKSQVITLITRGHKSPFQDILHMNISVFSVLTTKLCVVLCSMRSILRNPSLPSWCPDAGGWRGDVVQHRRGRPGGRWGGGSSLRQDEERGRPHGTYKQIHGEKEMYVLESSVFHCRFFELKKKKRWKN